MPTSSSIRDVCLEVGTHDISDVMSHDHMSSVLDDYHHLIRVTEQAFPRAYITVCSLLPRSTNHNQIKNTMRFCQGLRKLCSQYSYVQFVDLIPHLTHQGHQDFSYYSKGGFFLNNSSSLWIRNYLVSEIRRWRASSTTHESHKYLN